MKTFEESIEQDLDWRLGELASLKRMTSGYDQKDREYQSLLRTLIPLLYAHYEGFMKFIWETFLNHIEKNVNQRKYLKDSLCILSLENHFGEIKNSSDGELWKFLDKNLDEILEKKPKFNRDFESETNLYPDKLLSLSEILCLGSDVVLDNSSKLEELVRRRNDIAHGEKKNIDSLSDYQDFHEIVIKVMHEQAFRVIQQIDNEGYLKIPRDSNLHISKLFCKSEGII